MAVMYIYTRSTSSALHTSTHNSRDWTATQHLSRQNQQGTNERSVSTDREASYHPDYIPLKRNEKPSPPLRAQELCESRGGRPGLPSLISLMVSVDVKQHSTNHDQTEVRSCVKVEVAVLGSRP